MSEAFRRFFVRTLIGHEIELLVPPGSKYILGEADAVAIYDRLMKTDTSDIPEASEEFFKTARLEGNLNAKVKNR